MVSRVPQRFIADTADYDAVVTPVATVDRLPAPSAMSRNASVQASRSAPEGVERSSADRPPVQQADKWKGLGQGARSRE